MTSRRSFFKQGQCRFWSIPTLGWFEYGGWEYEKIGWTKARPVHGCHELSICIERFSPLQFVNQIPARKRTNISHEFA